jgi:hypothetical protein
MGQAKTKIDSTDDSLNESPDPKLAPSSVAPRLFRVIDITKYLNCTFSFADSLMRGRTLPVVVLGKRHLIDKRDLDDYIENLKSEGPGRK